MPNILTIPREIRDEIYKWGLLDTLTSSKAGPVEGGREQVEVEAASPVTYSGEEVICYPKHTPLPPTHSLLQTSRQLRTELLECMRRMGPLRYRIDVRSRLDKGRLYPSWISVPILAKRVDCIEVQLKIRLTGTSSVSSLGPDNNKGWGDDLFEAGFALLERFLERGVYLLSKKKREMMTVGLLAINIDEKTEGFSEDEMAEQIDAWGNALDEWMRGFNRFGGRNSEESKRNDKQFQFLSGKVGKVRLTVDKKLKREWDFKEMTQKREEERRSLQEDT